MTGGGAMVSKMPPDFNIGKNKNRENKSLRNRIQLGCLPQPKTKPGDQQWRDRHHQPPVRPEQPGKLNWWAVLS
jgi:hypothetical protein